MAHLRFAADILRRLGEELNPDPDQGILELVKNAYDADATHCVVELVGTDDLHGLVRVTDDGSGMSLTDVTDGWLVLGHSRKETRVQTPGGRIPAGNKGLGRLAALRLGEKVVLRTVSEAKPKEMLSVEIDWSDFESDVLVEQVPIAITRSKIARRPFGTQIEISEIRTRLQRMQVKRLARSLVLLADPFDSDSVTGFHPTLSAPEFEDLEKLVQARYFPDAEYRLKATLDADGMAHAQVVDFRGATLFEADHEILAVKRGGAPYKAPRAELDFYVFILDGQTFSTRRTTLGEVREWLLQFGGVHLYVNGLRVSPYGNAGNDWLEINLRRSQSPEERPSTNTSIGRVSVVDPDGILLQKTDRSGFVETAEFGELRQWAKDALEFLANERLVVAEARRERERNAAADRRARQSASVDEEIDRMPKQHQTKLRAAFNKYERTRDRETAGLRREVQLYRTLATAGITAATFAHESRGNPLKVIALSVGALERRTSRSVPADVFENQMVPPLSRIKRAVTNLGVLSSATLRLLQADKRRQTRVDVNDTVRDILATFTPFIHGRDVDLQSDLSSGQPFLRGSEAALEAIVTNLLNNSLVALEATNQSSRLIRVQTAVSAQTLSLVVEDNGPGIVGITLSQIWLPGMTTNVSGTGLGLTIVKDAVADLGGTVRAEANGGLGGACFIVTLPLLGTE